MRLQKYLAERGVASRRHAAEIVRAGRVSVNGHVALEPGAAIDAARDTVALDGRALPRATERRRTVALYKPRGYICSRADTQGRTVFALLPGVNERLVPAGRLDRDSEGLLVLSNDGDLVQRLTHPRHEHAKRYCVTVSGRLDGTVLARLNAPFLLEDGYRTRPAIVRLVRPAASGERAVLAFDLREGRNRQLRQMCRACGLVVHRLVRTAIGGLTLKGLQPGQWRDLGPHDLRRLFCGKGDA